jgi:type II secretory pathway pseudopilin PulG
MKKQQTGSTLLLLMVVILISLTATVTLIQTFNWQAKKSAERRVVDNSILILYALNDYFLAECSAAGNNSSAVTAPSSVDVLVAQGYLPERNYKLPFGGSYSLGIAHQGDGTILSVSFTALDADHATRLSRYGVDQATVEVSGSAVRFSRRTSQFDESDYRQDALAFQGQVCF